MNTDGTGFHTCKECHKTESLWNHTTTDHKEGEQLEDRRSVGTSSCYSGDGTDQRVQSLILWWWWWWWHLLVFSVKLSFLSVHRDRHWRVISTVLLSTFRLPKWYFSSGIWNKMCPFLFSLHVPGTFESLLPRFILYNRWCRESVSIRVIISV